MTSRSIKTIALTAAISSLLIIPAFVFADTEAQGQDCTVDCPTSTPTPTAGPTNTPNPTLTPTEYPTLTPTTNLTLSPTEYPTVTPTPGKPVLIIIGGISNSHGGTKQLTEFEVHVSGINVLPADFPAPDYPLSVKLDSGVFNVTEKVLP